MKKHDPYCPARDRSTAWEPEMCFCDVIRQVRLDERQTCAEDIGNMLRALPYVPANSPAAIAWAEKWVRDIHEEAE